ARIGRLRRAHRPLSHRARRSRRAARRRATNPERGCTHPATEGAVVMRWLKRLLALVVVLAIGIGIYGALYRPQTELPPGLQGQFIDVDGLRTRYVQAGAGPDVVLIHG